MNILDFKGSFVDMSRPTLYRVGGFGVGRQLEFLCKAAQLPASTIGEIEVPMVGGRKIKLAGDRIYAEWTITVMLDTSFALKKDFEDWHTLINEPILNVGLPAVEGYKRDGFIEQLDSLGQVVERYDIIGSFPTEVSAVDMSTESTDTIGEFTCTLSYDFWTRA